VEVVLVTEKEFAKGEAVFRSDRRFQIAPNRADEEDLSSAVRVTKTRAVIVGDRRYRGPLYDALAEIGGSRGAIIARFGVGHEGIDKALARTHGILVTNTPGALDQSVAEHTIWLLGALARRIAASDVRFRSGHFTASEGIEVAGKTLGVLGFGAIGRRVATIAHHGLGMRVCVLERRPPEELAREEGVEPAAFFSRYGVDRYTTDLAEVISQADVVSIHLPATPATRHFMNAERLKLLKPAALLINTARGSIVDEAALADALAERRLAGAALDVFETEPYEPRSGARDLRTIENVILTPHIGSHTREANERMAEACLDTIANFFAGAMERLPRVD
jgi:lactate dehydrogenase-like 2-hydroxyacid dehydrogenase